jgi:hypothetical protein
MTSSTITADGIRNALSEAGLSQYQSYTATVAEVVRQTGNDVDALINAARRQGVSVSYSTAETFLNSLFGSSVAEPQAQQHEVDQSFDDFRAQCAARLRGFAEQMTSDRRIIEQVDAVLIEVGLVDPEPEPEPEPEAVTSDEGSLVEHIEAAVQRAVAPLVAFARQHGYRG